MTQAGDTPPAMTFEKFVRCYTEYIRCLVGKRLYSSYAHNDSDDLVQQVLVRLWKNFHKLPPVEAQVKLYIRQTCRSVVIDYARKPYNRNEQLVDEQSIGVARDDDEEQVAELDKEFRDLETESTINAALDGLTGVQREALLLAANGWTLQEIATKQGVPVNTAKTRAYYGRRKARTNLANRPVVSEVIPPVKTPAPEYEPYVPIPDEVSEARQMKIFELLLRK